MIDYQILSDSINYYEESGFSRIESPWTVSEYIDNLTKPKEMISFQLKHNNKCLVASGEQSFLYLYLKNFLPKGQFQTTTPCFRFESFDYFHTKYFMKTELMKTDVVNETELSKIIDTCLTFYKKYLPSVSVITTDIGYDIVYNDIELGSYGIRSCEYLDWIYATGCAEPRLSNTIKLMNNGLS